jgi:hypothetical protein
VVYSGFEQLCSGSRKNVHQELCSFLRLDHPQRYHATVRDDARAYHTGARQQHSEEIGGLSTRPLLGVDPRDQHDSTFSKILQAGTPEELHVAGAAFREQIFRPRNKDPLRSPHHHPTVYPPVALQMTATYREVHSRTSRCQQDF